MLPVPQRIRHNWAVMGYLFGLVRQIDPDLKFTVDTFTLIGFLWFSKRFLGLFALLFSGMSTVTTPSHNTNNDENDKSIELILALTDPHPKQFVRFTSPRLVASMVT